MQRKIYIEVGRKQRGRARKAEESVDDSIRIHFYFLLIFTDGLDYDLRTENVGERA